MKITTEKIDKRTSKHKVVIENQTLSFSEWINLLKSSEESVLKFNKFLANSAFEAFFWEVKPVKIKSVNDNFEFALIDSTSLTRIKQNDSNFKQYFVKGDSVVNFSNLRGDAELIVPTPTSINTEYQHIASFVRSSEQNQTIEFWNKVATLYSEKINDNLLWLSTSGLGVHWLHVRIDNKPKYYQHLEYKI